MSTIYVVLNKTNNFLTHLFHVQD